jgi:hypothetical protein
MPDMEIVDALVGEAGGHGCLFLFKFEDEGQEALYVGWRDVISV